MSMVGPTERIEDTLHALDENYALQLIPLDDDDIRDRSKEEIVADRLMERREHIAGSVGVHKETYQPYVMHGGRWVRALRGEDGKHYLAE